MNDEQQHPGASKNRRLAIVLGFVAISIYVGYILVFYFDR